jgi:hypothetical protein
MLDKQKLKNLFINYQTKNTMNLKFILQLFSVLLFIFTLQSCVAFPRNLEINPTLTATNLTEVNGKYKVRAEKDTLVDGRQINYNNAFQKFYRGRYVNSIDTIKVGNLDEYTFGIDLIDNRLIGITYYKGNTSFKKFNLKYKLKDDGYIYIKNKNLKILGIPYIIGSYESKKIRLTTIDNYLIIEEVEDSSGAILLILGGSRTSTSANKYKKVE